MKRIFLLIACFSTFFAYSQYAEEDVLSYIDKYSSLAVQSMKTYHIPASVKLAQAIYSSNAGQSKVAKEAFNHFGLLCNNEYKGETYYETSDRSGNCYRLYNNAEESFQDHNLFLTTRPRYAALFELPIDDYRSWANGLQTCGYSINPEYAQRLINLIEKYNLTRFDRTSEKPVQPVEVEKTAEPEVAEQVTVPATVSVTSATVAEPQQAPTEPKTVVQPVADRIESPASLPEKKENTKIEDHQTVKPDTVIEGIEIYINRAKAKKPAKVSNSNAAESKPIINMNVFTAKDNEYRVSYFPYTQRDVYENNKIKFVIARKGDTYAKLAYETQLMESDLRTYNDVTGDYEPVEGEVVYLQLKNTKSDVSYHKLDYGDSFRYLSQKYAIQLKLLLKRNKQPDNGFVAGSLICIDCK